MKCRCRKIRRPIIIRKEEELDLRCGCESIRKSSCNLRCDSDFGFKREIECGHEFDCFSKMCF